MPYFRRGISFGLPVAILGFVLLACSKDSSEEYFGTTKPKHNRDTIWVNNGAEPEWIDPGKASGVPDGEIIDNLFAGLVQDHPKTLQPMPDIARNWKISADGKKYTFYLRPSKWTDGTPVTAHDFEWSWKRVLNPKTASKYASMLYPLKNGSAFNQKAVFVVDDFPSGRNGESILKKFSQDFPIERLEKCESPKGYFVYLGGEDDQRQSLRDKFIEKYSEAPWMARMVDDSFVGVKAKDDSTLEVELQDSIPYFLNLAAFYTFKPAPKHLIERLEREGINPDLWTRHEYVVSNGPYQMKEWSFRQYYLFERFDGYWDSKNTRTQFVRVSMVESYNTGLNFYRSGEVDWTGSASLLPGEFMDHLGKFKDLHIDPYLGVYYYLFNTKRPPLDHPLVREALALSIDRESIVKHVTRGGQMAWGNMVPQGLGGFSAFERPLYDPDRARLLLEKAGYPNGKGIRKLKLIYNTTEQHRQIAEAIQQMWKDVLGVEVELENQEWKVYLKNRNMMEFDIARAGWIGDYPDPFTFLELFSKFNGNNNTGWSNSVFESLLAKANQTADPQKRMRILEEAEKKMMSEYPSAPIYVYTKPYMKKPYLKGLWPNFRDRHPWKYMWIDDRFYDEVPGDSLEDTPPPWIEGRIP